MTRIVSFADSFTSASAPVISGADQENYIFIPETDQGLVPRIGENYVTIIQ